MNKKSFLRWMFAVGVLAVSLIGYDGNVGKVNAEGEKIIVREATGDLEPLEAIRISDKELEGYAVAESVENTSLANDDALNQFLTYGSDYGYKDMRKRSNPEGRQYAYRCMEELCRNFTLNGQNTQDISLGGEVFPVAGKINLSGYNMTSDEMVETYFTFRHDNPQYFWLSNQILYGSEGLLPLTYNAYKDGAMRKNALEEIVNTSQDVYQSLILSGESYYHKILKLHDALIADIEYSSDIYEETAHSIAGAMTSRKSAVCEGYTKVMQVMMNCYDISNIYVTGTAGGGHAWNMVGMDDGKYYWLDATWDDQPYEEFQHRYFLVGNDNFTDHTADSPTGTSVRFLYELPQASDTNYEYRPIEPVSGKGDINEDGEVSIVDLMMCLHHVSGNNLLTGTSVMAADIDGNGEVEIVDLMRLLHYVSGSSSEL